MGLMCELGFSAKPILSCLKFKKRQNAQQISQHLTASLVSGGNIFFAAVSPAESATQGP